jgi:5'-methylthioadenosine phosphorylase
MAVPARRTIRHSARYIAFMHITGEISTKNYKKTPPAQLTMLGIIGGSGLYSLGEAELEKVGTPYGEVEAHIAELPGAGGRMLFVPRHGKGHEAPPHKVNYRANVWAMKEAGVAGVLAFYAAGIIGKYSPGDLVLLDDFLGFGVSATFYDEFKGGKVVHADMGEPYDSGLSGVVEGAAKECGVVLEKGGIIATTPGPRFETKAEVAALGGMGANLVNMTSAYEAALCGELGVPLCGIAVGTNYACGVKGKGRLTHEEVLECMGEANGKIRKIVEAAASRL